MKKLIATAISAVLLAVSLFSLTAFAWETPELMLAAYYNKEAQTVTVYYRALDFAGTESADFRLRYESDVVQLADYETADMENVVMEVGEMTDTEYPTIAIQFVDLYHVEEEDCEEDGSATIATLTFNVIDKNAENAVFIATADSCYMDPDSTEVGLDRSTLKIDLSDGNKTVSTDESFSVPVTDDTAEKNNVGKVVIAAAVTAVVLIAGIIAVVIKYRKK